MSLRETAMLVQYSISQFAGRKKDKAATAEVTDKHGADSDAASVTKRLLPKEALEPITKKATEIRALVNRYTRPWLDTDTARILATSLYLEFNDKFAYLVSEFNGLADNLTKDYQWHLSKARQQLNGLYLSTDYPEPHELRKKFGVKIAFLPIPGADDFRISISESEERRIKADLETGIQTAIQGATEDLIKEIREGIEYINNIASEENTRFRKTAIERYRAMIELAPRLNITNDARINQAVEEISILLDTFDGDVLRESPLDRVRVKDESARIMKTMESIF